MAGLANRYACRRLDDRLTSLWLTFKASRYARWTAVAGGLLVALLTFGRVKKREGRKEERSRQEEIDHETADDVTDNAGGVSVRPNDQLDYRD